MPGCVASPFTRVEEPGGGSHNRGTLSYTAEGSLISRVLFAGYLGVSTVREITYGVPEPTTLAFVAFGLLGAALSRRRRLS
jgi:hypothetical protein